MSNNCLIYETLNGVKDLSVKRDGDLMTLSGVFGVCGVRNNNQRVYETSNYAKMVEEMKGRIKNEGGIPGELEHPQQMNITLENISHKITDINIDENGVVTGQITLLNTPKGKIAQAIVEGGLPLFISSRATGNIDKNGNVCLEKISTYDLVGTPGFSQAKLHLNENQIAESINESMYIIKNVDESVDENIDENNYNIDMDSKEILEKIQALEERIEMLEDENQELRESLEEQINKSTKKVASAIAEGVEKWIVDEYSPMVEKWVVEEFSPEVENWMNEEYSDKFVQSPENLKETIINTFTESIAPHVQNWVVEEFSPEIEKWCTTEFAQGIQNWVVEEFSPEVENWMNEEYTEKVQDVVKESKRNNLNAIDETLKLLESIEVQKPTYPSKVVVRENLNEPKYIQEMPAEKRAQWDMASDEVKESIHRRAKLYNFVNEGSIERFWENVNFENVKPAKSIYEGLETVENERERQIRESLRRWRSR